MTLGDPAFTALQGAHADFGRLGGTVYQIEMPDRWNGKLVLFMHGYGELRPEADVSPPSIRGFLIAQRYAWGASSFSSTSLIPGRAADETAALWDHFARAYRRPDRTYITGVSMGGAATNIAAERYGTRFDGGLALCGAAGQTAALQITTDFFVAAAWAAGVTQTDYDQQPDVAALVRDRIRPALRDRHVHDRFEDMMIRLTGGPRAFDREGFRMEEETNWKRAVLNVGSGLAQNRDTTYPDPAFDRAAVRLRTNADLRRQFLAGSETTGELEMPLLTLHTTGDGQVPIEQARIYQRRVNAAGASDLLVQRAVRDPGHCGFTDTEWAANLDALASWVEHRRRPNATDLLVSDLRHLDHTYDVAPRPGTREANAVEGADDRVVLHGTLTLDGAPLDTRFLGAVVVRDGLSTACQFTLPPVVGGRFEITVLADSESAGCGRPGARVYLWALTNGQQVYSTSAINWPGTGRSVTAAASFSASDPAGTAPVTVGISGEVLGPNGRYLPPGTRVEAFIGATRCGVASTRRTGSFAGYILSIAGPDAIAGCTRGASVTFRVDGRPARETMRNQPKERGQLDLTVG